MLQCTSYARHALGRTHRHQYRNLRSSEYTCFQEGCPSRRIIKEENDKYVVDGIQDHNHGHIAKSKRKRLSKYEQALLDGAPGASPLEIQRVLGSRLKLTNKQISSRNSYANKKTREQTWKDWYEANKNPHDDTGAKAIGFQEKESPQGVHQVLVVSSDILLDKLAEDARIVPRYICADGNHKHIHKHSLVQIGTQDKKHAYHPIAFAVLTGIEREEELSMLLDILNNYLAQRNLPLLHLLAG